MAQNDEALLRQYELMVNSALQVTVWRQNANNFYLAVNTTLLAAITFMMSSESSVLIMGILGIIISILWQQSIEYYKKLNYSKFKVIHTIEKDLPVKMFTLEGAIFEKERCNEGTQVEKIIPLLFGIAYILAIMFRFILMK